MINFLLAVALSISATNEYVFTEVVHTNFVGIGMGETFDYSVLRNEDRCFLLEALFERETVSYWLSSEEESIPEPEKRFYRGYPGKHNIPTEYTLSLFSGFYHQMWATNTLRFASSDSKADQKTQEIPAESEDNLSAARKNIFANQEISRKFADAYAIDDAEIILREGYRRAIVAAAYTNVYADIEANANVLFAQPARLKTGFTQRLEGTHTYSTYPEYYDENKGWTYSEDWPENIEYKEDFSDLYRKDRLEFYASVYVTKVLAVYMKNGGEISRQQGMSVSRSVNSKTSPDGKTAIRFAHMPWESVESVANTLAVIAINKSQATSTGQHRIDETRYFVKPIELKYIETTDAGCDIYGCDFNMTACFNEGMSLFGWRLPTTSEVESLIAYPSDLGRQPPASGYGWAYANASLTYSASLLGFVGSATIDYHAKVLKE